MMYDCRREIELKSILKHEMHSVPLALADDHNGDLTCTTSKSIFMNHLLTACNANCSKDIVIPVKSHLIVDGQALVLAMGKPSNACTFGDLSNSFVNLVRCLASKYNRVDIMFDRYCPHSIKVHTHQKRSATCIPIRRVIVFHCHRIGRIL